MAFHPEEVIPGWRHLFFRWEKQLLRRPADYYLQKLAAADSRIGQGHNVSGDVDHCQLCGYSMYRLELPSGWMLQMCSAMPPVKAPDAAQFKDWLATLTESELPTPTR